MLLCICLPIAYVTLEMHNAKSTFHIEQSAYDTAAWGVALVLHYLMAEPLLSYLLGNTSFWRIRGHFYDSALFKSWNEVRPY